jgi:hypothetical protein
MVAALLEAVANPPRSGVRIIDVPGIRRSSLLTATPSREKV